MPRQSLFGPIRAQKTLKDTAAVLLTERILSGKIKPGERLNESQLSRQLRISRAPIREALQQLLEQGLVMNITRRGMFVVSLDPEDVQKINCLRLMLEAEALRLARLRAKPSDFQKLAKLLKKMENTEPAPTNVSVRTDIEFHRTIWSLSGNEYLERTLTGLTSPIFAHGMLTLLLADKRRLILNSHRALFEFLQGRSKKSAEQVIFDHLYPYSALTRKTGDTNSHLMDSNGRVPEFT